MPGLADTRRGLLQRLINDRTASPGRNALKLTARIDRVVRWSRRHERFRLRRLSLTLHLYSLGPSKIGVDLAIQPEAGHRNLSGRSAA